MKLKKLKLHTKNNQTIEIPLLRICDIVIVEGKRIIISLKNRKDIIINKKDLNYPNWTANIDLIRTLFEDEK